MIVAVTHDVRRHFVERFADWLLATMLADSGLTLLRSGDVFAVQPAWQFIVAAVPADRFGMLCLGIGLWRLAALLFNGTFDRLKRFTPAARAMGSFVSAGIWFIISFGILATNVPTLVAGLCFGLMIGDIVNFWLAMTEAGIAERKYRSG